MPRRTLLFILVWLSCLWFGSWSLNPNNLTRLLAASSLVEGSGGRIDELQLLTIDKAEFDGHFYSDKAPGMTLLALPAVALADRLGPERPSVVPAQPSDARFEPWMQARLILAVATVSALLTALGALALYDLVVRLTANHDGALFAGLGFALGTPVWGWSTTVFGHAPVASLFMAAVWGLWRAREDDNLRFAAIGGAALGLAALIEFDAVLAGGVIAIWGAFTLRRPDRIAIAAVAGTAVLAIPFVAYNLWVFGVPVRLGYQGVTGFPGMEEGVFGLTFPKPHVLWSILFGLRRGIVWVAPILILAPVGLWWLRRRDAGLSAILAVAACVVLLVNSAYFYWDGGHSTGPRHSVAAIGLLAVGLGPFWAALRHRWQMLLAAGLLMLSILINLAIAAANIAAPDTYAFPLWDPILKTDWPDGVLRTLPSELFGASPFMGVALYLVLALPLAVLLLSGPPQQGAPRGSASRSH